MSISTPRTVIRHRRALGSAVVAVAALALVLTQSILAVHDLAFQLDGDVSASTSTTVGGHTQGIDWSSLFNADTTKKALPSNFTASVFSKDFLTTTKRGKTVFDTSDSTTYTTGSKDTLEINTGWQCSASNNLLSKNDIMNAYATAYTDPNTGHQILYFALERNSNNGDANVAFWFLQNNADCDSSNGTASWSGTHTDGDILIVSAFTNGGGVSGIDAYRWNVVNGVGSLGTTSVAHGSDCNSTGGGDAVCATTNGSASPGLDAAITTPWQTANTDDGVGTTLQPSEFFEGGIDLTAKGLGNHCFNTFVGDTRSSQSLTATIFDYARGVLGECSSSTSTQAKDGAGNSLTSVDIPATGTLAVKDTATVTVNGISSFSGTVQFYLCGPSTTTLTSCSSSTGTAIGSTHAITASGSVDQTATLTSAGRYCWAAVFSGDATAGVPGSHDNGTNECFVVNPLQPTLATQATSGPVNFGDKISDTVTLSGTANKPGTGGLGNGTINTTRGGVATGNITLTAYGPDSCSTVAYGPVSLAASGDSAVGGTGTTFEFQPSSPGQYVFVASYAGDSPNTLGVTATACSSQPSNEKVTVQQIPTSIKTKQSWYPNDTATVAASAGNLASGGSVVFTLYSTSDCSGSVFYTETKSITGGSTDQTVSTANTTVPITTLFADAANSTAPATGVYSWKVVYTPAAADTAHLGIQSACSAEHFNITYTNDNGPGTALP